MAVTKHKEHPFIKMHGLGNDVVVFDCLKHVFSNPTHLARKLLNRHTGIGGDQMVLLTKSRKADFGMRTFNSDGSEAEMCGNGIRCLARFIRDAKITTRKELNIETLAGIRHTKFIGNMVEVDMGEPQMKGKEIPVNLSGRVINRPLRIESKDFRITCLAIGNPHCVIFHDDVINFPVEKFGPLIENYHLFPRRVNVSFVNVLSKNDLQMRVWERGTGETRSCGTAACAAAVAAVLNGFAERKVTVSQPGGLLVVSWDREDNHIYLRGPAEAVYKGTIVI
jgi:diaminopimelate epimerase